MRASIGRIALLSVTLGTSLPAQAPARLDSIPRRLADHPRVKQASDLLAAWLDAQRGYEQIPGLSAAVVYDQQLVWSGGFGYTDLERKAPATAQTVYSICSISKLFTSVATMQLRDAGKLRLDDPVGAHLPWFKIKRDTAGPEITVEGLLTHSSGLPREADYPYWSGPDFRFPTHDEVVSRVASQQTLYPAASRHQYSNLGITLAGEIVAARSGMSYDEYVRRNILEPLGLTSTTTDMPQRLRGAGLATGYSALTREGKRAPLPFFSVRGIGPAAGFTSTAEDLARFAMWQFRLLNRGGTEILKANTLREMHRVHWVDPEFETTWGLGFAVWRANDKTFVGHGGSCPGYGTHLLLRPADKVATIFMGNALGVPTGRFTQVMYAIMTPAVQAAARDTARASRVDTALVAYTGRYDSQPWGGETLVFQWEDGLALLGLPTTDPVPGIVKLTRATAPHTFHLVRRDGSLADVLVFEMGADGRPTKYWRHSNPYTRLGPVRP
jgi:CubicO group peptidase (beta-lactamase class C family)